MKSSTKLVNPRVLKIYQILYCSICSKFDEMSRIVVTAFGKDRTGIVASISKALADRR